MTPPSEIAQEAADDLRERIGKDYNVWINSHVLAFYFEAAIEKATVQVLNRAMEAERYAIKCEHDTKRLDWLETNVADLLCRAESGKVVWLVYANLVEAGRGATPRAAIDAAMKGEVSRDQR